MHFARLCCYYASILLFAFAFRPIFANNNNAGKIGTSLALIVLACAVNCSGVQRTLEVKKQTTACTVITSLMAYATPQDQRVT